MSKQSVAPPPASAAESAPTVGLREAAGTFMARVRAGEIGSLPIVVGLLLIGIIFQSINSTFLTPRNLANLATNSVSVGVIAVGVVLVLLVAHIDLSVGSMSGAASSILGVALTNGGWPLWLAIVVALAVGALVGIIYSYAYTRFSVPSFVSTLAGLLALLGLQLELLKTSGSINIPFNSAVVGFMQRAFVPEAASYALAALCAVAYLGMQLLRSRRRAAHHLPTAPLSVAIIKAAALLVGLEFACWYLNLASGFSWPFVMLVVLVIVVDIALTRTHWGRSIYAVGGSVEAARRAGIKLERVYLSVFILCSVLAAFGGILFAGQIAAASTGAGAGNVNLDAIAAAVIGGTSLFGGRGGAYSALLGIIVIEAIDNGLVLLSLPSSTQYMITGGVLMIAVIVDSLARRRRESHGVE